MQEKETFIVEDLSKLVEATRVLVFDNFGKTNEEGEDDLSFLMADLGPDEIDELNDVLTQEECLIIAQNFVKPQVNKRTKKIRYIMTNTEFMEMVESFNSRMISNLLNSLVNKGVLETAYDEKCNDFIFWVKNENENETDSQKPETD
jgi:hypothetical protein